MKINLFITMKKILLSSIAVAGISFMTLAQKDTTIKKPIIKDTIKPKQTGVIYSTEHMLAFGPQTDSIKAKPKVKSDTIKSETKMNTTGYLPVSSSMIALLDGPQTDSTKKATVKPDSIITKPAPEKKTGALYFNRKTGTIIALPKDYTDEV